MITKKGLLTAIWLLMAVSLSSLPNTASASIFDWLYASKVEFKSQSIAFVSMDQENASKLLNESTSEKTSWQLLNNSTIMAMNVSLPDKKTPSRLPKKIYYVTSTAYSSTEDQTDDTPFITAMGTHVRDGVVAANFLPFGTVLRIPEIYGDKTFVVEDRMNNRYDYRIDLWFPTREAANDWGVKKVKIEIIS